MRRRFPAKALTERLMAFNGLCAECGCKVGGAAGLEWDHIIPLEMGGEDTLENLQPLCKADHKSKTAKDFGHIAKSKRMAQRDMGVKKGGLKEKPRHIKHPPSKRYPQGRVVDRETGETVWPR